MKFREAKITDRVVDIANFNKMVDWLGRLANMNTDGSMYLEKGPNGFLLGVRSAVESEPAMFDIYDQTATTFKIKGDAKEFGFAISGVFLTPGTSETGIDWDTAFDITIFADAAYVYIKAIRDPAGWTLECDDDIPDGDDVTRYYPLWKIVLFDNDGTANIESVLDMRPCRQIDAMA